MPKQYFSTFITKAVFNKKKKSGIEPWTICDSMLETSVKKKWLKIRNIYGKRDKYGSFLK